MLAIVSLLVVLALSILVTRIATSALTHTGLSRETARFQARSAFTGVGYTTTEAERIVNHPVRRRIALFLMLLGNAGIVTVVSSLIIGFVGERQATPWAKIALLAAGVVALWLASSSRWVDRKLSHLIDRALARYTDLEVRDYASLLHLAGEYHVSELMCQQDDWLEGQSLAELRLRDEGVMVLGITRDDGTYLGAPDGDTVVRAGDTLLLYGRAAALESLDARQHGRSGDREHESAVVEHERCIADERARDPADEHASGS